MIRLVATDLDGTLFDNLSRISPANRRAIQRLQDKGITFTIASGRDYTTVLPTLEKYSLHCEAILGNGSQYIDADGNLILSCYMDKSIFLRVIDLLNQYRQYYMIFTTDGFYTGCDPQAAKEAFIERGIQRFHRTMDEYLPGGNLAYMPCNHLVPVEDFHEFITRDLEIIKVEAFNMETSAITAVKHRLKEMDGIAYLSSFDDNIEVTDAHAQKGLILQKVAEMKGLKRDEVMVLGDGMNDISLFECFPDWSFAPANAAPMLRAIAHQVVSSNLKDGFAEAVNLVLDQLGQE
ncbi:MAG: Cof-type HAD-IIB family hydrolase [Clostridiales bacterium]|nr:Cof-type HAD-IIB family hydrolase [Clostridiales bacterium]